VADNFVEVCGRVFTRPRGILRRGRLFSGRGAGMLRMANKGACVDACGRVSTRGIIFLGGNRLWGRWRRWWWRRWCASGLVGREAKYAARRSAEAALPNRRWNEVGTATDTLFCVLNWRGVGGTGDGEWWHWRMAYSSKDEELWLWLSSSFAATETM
jgi:hypothetical protein